MKKVYQLLALAAVLFIATSCEFERRKMLTVEELPEAAQTYLKEKYPDAKVLYVKKEKKNFKTWYEVRLDNQLEIEFNNNGELYDIDVDD